MTVELEIDKLVSEREVRELVKSGIDQLRAEIPNLQRIASTLPCRVLSYREVK